MEFHGAYAADMFIEAIDFSNQSTGAYIVNTEQSYSRGRHCVAIIQKAGKKFELFDPLGHAPWDYANRNIFGSIAFNSHELQNPLTNRSAHISLLYLYFSSHCYSFQCAIEWFRSLFLEFGSLALVFS